ncbi:MAG: LuxR family transcriptional regulator [Planctomycetaceae bacterium]|nr:LuxR family transcriptional regulator [Planctomycetaceae bacterium]
MSSIRLLIADDHALIRSGIRALLEDIPGFQVVGEASDGRIALELIPILQPHLLLMDVAMPNLNGLEATSRVTKEFPNVRVIMLSMHATEEYVCQAIRAGVAGYLLKNAETSELEFAIKAVARGESYLTPAVSKYMIASYMQLVDGANPPAAELLTERQREVLQLIAEGKSTKEVASILEVSVKTIKTHRAQLMKRLDVHDIAGLVRYAIRAGLVQTDN